MNVKENFKFKLPIFWINAIADSVILARCDVFCLLFSVAQEGQRSGLLGKALNVQPVDPCKSVWW